MKICTATLKSLSPYSQSRLHETDKLDREGPDDYERRTWREKCHTDSSGHVFIPPMAFKKCVQEAAKYSSRRIPGKGQATYTKHFKSGVLVMDPLILPVTKDEIAGEWIFANADGVSGSGKRVKRCFPVVSEWSGEVVFYIADQTVTEDVFEECLADAGQYIGIGRFRPSTSGGFYGRFVIEKTAWSDV